MKKAYKKPILLMESFGVTQMLTNCTLKIGFNSMECVLNDENSTLSMWELAMAGYFYVGGCEIPPNGVDHDDGVCYHTSVNLAFTS